MRSGVVVAVSLGVAIAVQVAVLGRASRYAHPLSISLALQAAGLIVGLVWVLARGAWDQVGSVVVQWWWLPVGALGWVIVAGLGFASERIGVSTTVALVVAAQLIAGLGAARVSGEVVLSMRHPLGVVLLLAGVILISTTS